MLCVAAACAIGCGDRSSATKREREAAPVAPPPASSNQPAVPASAQSGPQRPNDPSLLRDEEGLIGVQNSSGRSGAFYVPGGSGINGLPLLVILHGTGQSGSDMIATFRDLAKARRFAIVAPDSRDHSGQLTWEVGDKPGRGGTSPADGCGDQHDIRPVHQSLVHGGELIVGIALGDRAGPRAGM